MHVAVGALTQPQFVTSKGALADRLPAGRILPSWNYNDEGERPARPAPSGVPVTTIRFPHGPDAKL
eukprot:scaffold5181_cov370-Prasinococcus_capsulatus_cf.AAC.3